MKDSERDWAAWMTAASNGDAAAYRRLLDGLAPFLRAVVGSRARGFGFDPSDAEDVVQEALLAIHLKRGTWDSRQPVGPWAAAIARNKLIDAARRRGRRVSVPIDDFVETLAADEPERGLSTREAERLLSALNGRQRDVVAAITVEGADIGETADRLGMSEGAVRVALHRGLASLSRAYRSFRE
ncbi:MAG: RNA polymerase subunit sigma [Ancylobacter novellus]|uniref:RNA polymerase subunit sigma n=1 Tax=Ancylobacter novellus TaxID=921 RepID=A0A2W5K747_ANCNO|nr:MAG: RNA polymerase subunit sigma [Ancylobacter novellus]